MAEHTPGPWITDTSHWQDREGVTIWAESKIIADVVPDGHNQEQANARLIASAPDLLACLQNLIDRGLIVNDNDHYEECIKAIAKATGKGVNDD